MATIGTAVTLADIAASMVDKKIQAVAEVASQTNEILEDMAFIEANGLTGHTLVRRSGLPTVGMKRFNAGVAPSKSTSEQVTEVMGMVRGWSQINGNTAAYRTREAVSFIESINQFVSQKLLYGNHAATPEDFDGIAPRYASLSGVPGLNGNVISALGDAAGGQTSIYLVGWGDMGVSGIYPKGSLGAGLSRKDHGELVIKDSNGKLNSYLVDEYLWDLGIAIHDWKYVVRICNIEVQDLAGATPPDLIKFMCEAEEMIPNLSAVRPAFIMHRRVASYLRNQIRKTTNVNLTFDTAGGKRVLAFDGIPIRRTDQVLCATANSEAIVA
jgi:hypothetical protein